MRALPIVLLAVSCGSPPVVPLHARQFYGGTVEVVVEGSGARRFETELTFDRDSENYQMAFRREESTDAMMLMPDGEIRGFSNGAVRPPSPQDRSAFELVMELLKEPPASAELEAWATGYALRTAERRVVVELADFVGHAAK